MLSRTKRKEVISSLEKSIKDINSLVKGWEEEDAQKNSDLNKTPIKAGKTLEEVLNGWLRSEKELLKLESEIRKMKLQGKHRKSP